MRRLHSSVDIGCIGNRRGCDGFVVGRVDGVQVHACLGCVPGTAVVQAALGGQNAVGNLVCSHRLLSFKNISQSVS